jgi:hypothetical protein
MADTIVIPSPRVFLTASPPISKAESPPQLELPKPKQIRKRTTTTTANKGKAIRTAVQKVEVATDGVEKKKQTKSRNGMSFYKPFRFAMRAFR